MNLRLRTCVLALLAGCALPAPGHAQIEGVFIQSTPERDAPSYDSDYAAEARLRAAGSTPEADARPGEVFFLRAAEAVRRHDYAFAIQMYEVSASWAYKPAEYNLGVMYARGQGVEIDLPRAMAWMALAAERNEKHYVDAREAIYASMSKEQFEQANVIWRELKKTYGDEVALARAKRRWAEVRSHITGSRVGFVGNLQVGMREPGSGVMGPPKSVLDSQKKPGVHGTSTGPTTAGEILGGNGVDGSIAYRQLLQSDDPYDPKFENLPAGTAIVGPPEPATADPGADKRPQQTDKPDPAGGQR
jgi:Sel1 repeat